MDVTDWLRSLGLDRYARAFRENEISADLLVKLTAQDLRDLGVAAVGHRRRLLDAIAALHGEAARAGDQPQAPEAERRHITVLFCDLVGSTPLSTRLDPEDLRELLEMYRTRVVAAITGAGGYVARFFGDGVLAYFGWPNADEAHAESAVRAALASIEAVRPHQLPVRIGVATGLVVVGDLIGTGAAREHPAIGETPNLAARLQALAEPDTIVVSEATRSQLGRMFELEALGPVPLKGFEKPVNAWRVRRGTGIASRSEALYAGPATPLIGREEELDLLLRRWRQAKSGEGRTVLLSGEAGIGKSRLLAALEERLANEPHVSLRYFCSPHHQDSALHPITARMEQEAGFSPGDTAEERSAKLEAVLAPTAPPLDDVALFAALLSIPAEGRFSALQMSPQRQKERTFAALTCRLGGLARSQPVLILFEDAHWSDPTSLELLDAVIEQIADLPVLLVVSFRPEFSPPWFGRSGVRLMTLSRLDRRDATALAAQIIASRALSSALLDRIVAQADGVPLFIEELTKAVLEKSEFDVATTFAVPATLQASLMARLDRLPAAKQVAQIGSVIGREFSHTLIAAVAQMPESLLVEGLEELLASGLAFRRNTPSASAYVFKHALVQDVAYDSLLRSRRAEIHARVAEKLERDGDNAGPKLALLGYHYASADLIEQAAFCYCSVGERLIERAGFVETERLLRRGLALAATLAESPRRRLLQAELWGALARILMLRRGSTDPETAFALEQGVELSRGLDDVAARTRALWRRAYGRMQCGNHIAAWGDAQELLKINEKSGSFAGRSLGHVLLTISSFLRGHFEAARVNAASALLLSGARVDDDINPVLSGFPREATFACFSTLIFACLGHVENAELDYCNLRALARQLEPSARVVVYAHFPRIDLLIFRDANRFEEHTCVCEALSAELGLAQFALVARLNQGWLTVRGGSCKAGLAEMHAVIDAMHAINYLMWIPYCYFLIADALTFSGRHAEARDSLHEGLALTARTGEIWLDAELRRLAGELLLKGHAPDPSRAEQELWKAIDIARGQSAKLFELRAATSLARLWSGQGRRAEARDLLTPICNWFSEALESPDLQQARQILAELG